MCSLRNGIGVFLIIVALIPPVRLITCLGSFHDSSRDEERMAFLVDALHTGRADEMQMLFPEGEFFTWTLAGLSAARLAADGRDPSRNRELVDEAVEVTGRLEVANRFGSDHRGVPHGAFYHGWRLLLLVAQVQAQPESDQDPTLALDQAQQLLGALDNPEPLTSYPGQAWPCDLVVAWAAVHRAATLGEVPGLAGADLRLAQQIDQWRDPATELIGHQFTSDGHAVSPARGTSQSIINTYLPDVSQRLADQEWQGFTEHFLVSYGGLTGVREYPIGQPSGGGDIDSGPLIAGVSLSASAVALGAAIRHGDERLATDLYTQEELLATPVWTDRGLGRAVALGVMPVADAFVLTSHTLRDARSPADPGFQWHPWQLALLIPTAIGLGLAALVLRSEHSRIRRIRRADLRREHRQRT